MRPHVVARTERVVDEIVVVFQADALRFVLDDGGRHHVEVAKLPKEGKAWVIIAHDAGLIDVPQVRPDAHAQRGTRELVVDPVALGVEARVFCGSRAAKHVGAARVVDVGAVVNEVAIEELCDVRTADKA